MSDKVKIFDTTLRDGEQSPGAALTINEKVEIAKQLNRLNVDIIEAGFPVSSKEQFEAVKIISESVDTPIAALARSVKGDIDSCYESLRYAKNFRIHTFIGSSDIHILGKFGSSNYGKNLSEKRATVIKMACDSVKYAKTFTNDVEFSAEDAGRTDMIFLCELLEQVINSGATTINIPDTTGYTTPNEYGNKISELFNKIPNIDKSVVSVHCHNDLGLAVANSLSALSNGARQVECTINGIGERAGNASMEEIVMALNVRSDYWNLYTDINTKEILNSSKMVSGYTGMLVQPNKAIVGDNAFAHESGIHQDGVLKNRNTYEIMKPETVGITDNKIILGRHSGRHGLLSRLRSLGYDINEDGLKNIYNEFLILADKKKEIFDEDLRFLMGDKVKSDKNLYVLDYLNVNIGTTMIPTATIRIKKSDKMFSESATGDGPVDACFRAINRALKFKKEIKLKHFQVRSISAGKGAQGEVTLRLQIDGNTYQSKGVSTDTIEASTLAYIKALNQCELVNKNHTSKITGGV